MVLMCPWVAQINLAGRKGNFFSERISCALHSLPFPLPAFTHLPVACRLVNPFVCFFYVAGLAAMPHHLFHSSHPLDGRVGLEIMVKS